MLKSFVKSTARSMGFELRRDNPATSHAAQLRAMLLSQHINLIFDVGANAGQYGRELRSHVGYRGRIVSFEPLKHAHEALCKAARGDEGWEVAERVAIGSEDGTAIMNVAANSVSSSILPMLEAHSAAAPESCYESTETVALRRLDSIAPGYLRADSVPFLKIDTQGYEKQVLDGAPEVLSRVAGVQLELSMVPLYEGQALMPDLIEYVNDMGFELWGISPTFADPKTGRMLQVDATFFRK